MSTLPRRPYGIFVTAALAVVAAVVAGAILFTSSSASNVELTTARFVPADTGLYVAFNTNLDSSQWIAAFDLARRLGQERPRQQLEDSAAEAGLSWQDQVAPFLGGNAAVFVRDFGLDYGSANVAAILKAKDASKALAVLLDRAAPSFAEGERSGRQYYFNADQALWVARLADHLVLANREETLFEVFDVADGKVASLDQDSDYKQLRDELTSNFLAFAFVDAGTIAAGAFAAGSAAREALRAAGLDQVAFAPMAFVLGAKGDGFEFQAASVARGSVISPMLEPRPSRFATLVPADASFFAVTRNIAQTWRDSIARARPELDRAIREEGQYRSLDEALRAAGAKVGLGSIEELINLFGGETAVAAWFPGGDQAAPEFALLAEVQDEAEARRIAENLLLAGGGRAAGSERIAGVEVTIVRTAEGDDAAFATRDGYLLLGTLPGVRATLEARAFLATEDAYRRTIGQVPTALGSYAYFNLRELLRLQTAGVPPQLDTATRALEGLIVNAVTEKDIARFNGALTVAK